MKTACPKCQSTDIGRWSSRSSLTVFADAIVHAVLAYAWSTVGDLFGFEGLRYKRICRKCGHKFYIPTASTRRYDHCPKCEYNLTGNTSGVCPECGWKIPQWWREKLHNAGK